MGEALPAGSGVVVKMAARSVATAVEWMAPAAMVAQPAALAAGVGVPAGPEVAAEDLHQVGTVALEGLPEV